MYADKSPDLDESEISNHHILNKIHTNIRYYIPKQIMLPSPAHQNFLNYKYTFYA